MVLFNEGINKIRDFTEANINQVLFRSTAFNTTFEEASSPGGLATAIDTTPTTNTFSKTLQITGDLAASDANGETIHEAITAFDNDNALGGIEFTDISKTSNKQISFIQTVVFDQV